MDDAVKSIVGVATLIVTLAIIAVLVKKDSQTSQVIQAAGTAFTNILGRATGGAA